MLVVSYPVALAVLSELAYSLGWTGLEALLRGGEYSLSQFHKVADKMFQVALHYRRINYSLRFYLCCVSDLAVLISVSANRIRFILPDFPHTTRWLNQEERAIATKRLQHASGSRDTERGPLLGGIKMAVLDYKVWLLA